MSPGDSDGATGSRDSDWTRVKNLTADALELSAAEREAFLAGLSAEPREVREQVARLVAVSAGADDRVDLARDAALAGVQQGLDAAPAPDASWAGREVGGYRIQRFVARGGMGAVFEATQAGTGKRVAIKVLAQSSSEAWRARFRHEIGLLARLSHPAIAQIVDADLHEDPELGSRPFFALEFVDGASITRFADEQGLDLDARLRMMIDVCRGVQHAHQRGVLHRDLKPENILVERPEGGGPPQPKVLDFGIGRLEAAGDATEPGLTREGDVLGTLAYMSPEQVGGNPAAVDTRSDVYALGVLLYRLVTGELPIDVRGLSLSEAALRIAQASPRPASSLRPELDADVDTICAAAMAGDKERRYASASELAADLERYLANEPLAAQPASRLHHLRLFTRRHRGLTAGLVATLVVFVLGAAGTGAGFLNAQRQAERASSEAARARRASAFLGEVLASSEPEILGREGRMRDALALHAPRIDTVFTDDDRGRAELHEVVGVAWFTLGEYADACEHLASAHELFLALDGADSEPALRTEASLLGARTANGEVSGDALEAARALTERTAERLGPADRNTLKARSQVAYLLLQSGQVQEALAVQRETYAATLAALGPTDQLTLDYGSELGAHLTEAGEYDEAGTLLEEIYAASVDAYGPGHPRTLNALNRLATVDSSVDRSELAIERFDRALADARETWDDDHPLTVLLRANRASALMGLGRFEDALAEYRDVHARRTELFGAGHPQTLSALYNVGVNLAYTDRPAEAAEATRELLRLAGACEGCDEGFVMRASGLLAGVLTDLDRLDEAVPMSARALEEHRRLLGPTHFQTLIQENNHARLLGRSGREEEGIALFEAMLARWTAEYPEVLSVERTFRWNFARLLEQAGRAEEAEREFLRINELEPDAGPDPRPTPAEVYERLASFYEAQGREADAAAAREARAALDG
ncbi:MAG: serine/threonine-protein kinase [Planctomycetota bacterium]